eukprot:1176353-Prorocentrum_minimum.AAC.5
MFGERSHTSQPETPLHQDRGRNGEVPVKCRRPRVVQYTRGTNVQTAGVTNVTNSQDIPGSKLRVQRTGSLDYSKSRTKHRCTWDCRRTVRCRVLVVRRHRSALQNKGGRMSIRGRAAQRKRGGRGGTRPRGHARRRARGFATLIYAVS